MWEWFNNKKTIIGAVALWVANTIQSVLITKYQIDPIWLRITTDILMGIGEVMVPVGLGHKAYKAVKNGNA